MNNFLHLFSGLINSIRISLLPFPPTLFQNIVTLANDRSKYSNDTKSNNVKYLLEENILFIIQKIDHRP